MNCQISSITLCGFSPATEAIIAYIKETQKVVNGIAKVKLYKGHAQVVARQSANSLYDENLATYTSADSFDQDAAIGFIKLWGLPTQVNSQVNHPFEQIITDFIRKAGYEKKLLNIR